MKWRVGVKLSSIKKVEMRQAYTILDLLGDFGGFNDAVYFLLSIPMGIYSSSMYSKHIASSFRLQSQPDSERSSRSGSIENRISSQEASQKSLINELKRDRSKDSIHLSFIKALFYCNCLCKRDKKL